MNATLNFLGLSALLLTGCASTPSGPLFSAEPSPMDSATVYVFRQDTAPFSRKPDILFNDTVVAELPKNSYFVVQLRPGAYTVRSDWGVLDNLILSKSTTLSAQAGKAYYMEFTGRPKVISTTVVFGSGIETLEASTPPPQISACIRVNADAKQVQPR